MSAPNRSRHSSCRALTLLVAWLSLTGPACAATIVVTDAGDPGNGVCDSVCTLREAITQANGTAIADTINFAIPTPIKTEIVIAPLTALPTITKPLTINGYSQTFTSVNTLPSGTDAKLRIRLDGSNVANGFHGLAVCSNFVNIKGLSITNFNGAGIAFGRPTTSTLCADPITNGSVTGNFIGLRSDGTTAAPNDGVGVQLVNAVVVIGGATPDLRNVISANGQQGVAVVNAASSGSSIQGNLIGTDRSGTLDRGNSVGISLESTVGAVSIGGASPNVVAFNNLRGIGALNAGQGNSWFANRVFGNDELGIDLGALGVTPNDVAGGDADTGPNGLQNFPEIFTAVRVVGGLAFTGKLEVSNPPASPGSFQLAFYASASCDPSGFGEGERYLGSVGRNFSTSSEAYTIATLATTDPLPAGTVITATATDSSGSSSEFSACFALDLPPLEVNNAGDADDGACNAAHCTLREAINGANARPGADSITFAIPGGGVQVIAPATALPKILEEAVIDGYTQPGASPNTQPVGDDAVILIRIDGAGAGANVSGLVVCGDESVVRGLSITGFAASGVVISATECGGVTPDRVQVVGNFIGLLPNGDSATSNIGVFLGSANDARIGTSAAADRNVISGNAGSGGVFVINGGDDRRITNNYIGTDPSGTQDRGNFNGILLSTNASGLRAENGNRIAFNVRGVRVDSINGSGNALFANAYFANDTLGIDLGAVGVLENDPDDADGGPNKGQNFPELTLARRSAGGLRVEGTLDVPAGNTGEHVIAVYASAACDPSGHGEGERYLGSRAQDLTDGAGEAFAFDLATSDPLPEPSFITATATFEDGSTSEFSACLPATDPSTSLVVTSTADTGGTTCGATCTLRQAINAANLAVGENEITFAIPTGPFLIAPATPLPTITDAVFIDGYSQPGASDNALEEGNDAVILIHLDGAGAGAGTFGLGVCASDSDVQGLSITGFNGAGVGIGFDSAGSTCGTAPERVGVTGNFIGLNPDGSAAGNNQGGVLMQADNDSKVGGLDVSQRNVISANLSSGVFVGGAATGRRILNNYIGTDPGGSADRGNLSSGVLIGSQATGVSVGTNAPNRIAYNQSGVVVSSGAGAGNEVYANEIFGNDTLGIELGSNGVSANDADDGDGGGNGGQNFPVLNSIAVTANGFQVDGTLDVPAATSNAQYQIALYESASCDSSGNGEGEILLFVVTESFSGNDEDFSIGVKLSPPAAGHVVTATATDPGGSTSEFSACLLVTPIEVVFSDGYEDQEK